MTHPQDQAEGFVRATGPVVLEAIDAHPSHRVIYHADVDGLCAAACLARLIGERTSRSCVHAWVPTSEFHFANWAVDYPPTDGTLTVTADINFTSRRGFLAELDALYGASLVVIDDHVINEGPPQRLKLVNPNLGRSEGGAIDLAASLYAFQLAVDAGCEIPRWVPVLGLYFDRQLSTYASLFPDVPVSRPSLDRAIRTLSSLYLDDTADHFADRSLELLTQAIEARQDWKAFCATVQADALLRQTETANQSEIEARFRTAVAEIRALGRLRGQPASFHAFSSRLQIANIIASRLRGQNPAGIYIALRHGERFAQIELRLGLEVAGVDLVEILRALSLHVPFTNFGGHPRAAGGAVAIESVPVLIEQLQAMVTD